MIKNLTNRWIILSAGALCNFCLGVSYAWSIFQRPLMDTYNWTPSQVSLAFTLVYVVMTVSMVVAGRIQDRHGPKLLLCLGGIMWGGGIAATGFAATLWQLYLTYGVIGGLGNGAVYSCTVANTVKWFPDKKGLATGLIVSAAGVGAVVSAPIISWLVYSYGVTWSLKILGVFYGAVIVLSASLIDAPPAGYRPAGWKQPKTEAAFTGKSKDKNWREMLADPIFYILWLMYALGAASGLMVIGHAASIGQEVIRLSAATAALAVSILALANTCGRVFWGFVSDKIGRYRALTTVNLFSAASMSALILVSGFYPFLFTLFIIGLCYGGIVVLFPSITSDLFGSKNLGLNYGILFTAFSAAALIGPRLAAKYKEITGDYVMAFIVAAFFGVFCMLLSIIVLWRIKLRQQQIQAQM